MKVILLSAVALVVLTTSSCGGDDPAPTAQQPVKEKVKVIIAGTNDTLTPVTDGGITGEGTFKASGAITDHGTARGRRWMEGTEATGWLISLRYVTKGTKGAITYVVRIDTKTKPVTSRWTIESGTKAYKGLQGEGTETENARYTVSTLKGTVWR